MPPSGPSTPTGPSSLKKAPPTGPKSQSSVTGTGTGTRVQPIAIPFGSGLGKPRKAYNGLNHTPTQGQAGRGHPHPHASGSSYNRSPYQYQATKGSGYDSHSPSSSLNGHASGYGYEYDYSSPSAHAESSRQAVAKAIPTGPSGPREKKGAAAGAGAMQPPKQVDQTNTKSGAKSRSRSPSPDKSRDTSQASLGNYGTSLSHTDQSRTPIKIAFPALQVNGQAHDSSKSTKTTTKSPNLPPPPPSDRPPTPPLGDIPPPPPPPPDDAPRLPSPPPPPPDDSAPPSPPLSPIRKSQPLHSGRRASPVRPPTPPPAPTADIALPPTPPSLPPPPPAQQVKISIALPGHKAAPAKDAPPAFHFREIPVRRRSPSPDDDNDNGSVASSSRAPSPVPEPTSTRPPSPPLRQATPSPPPYVPPPYTAPACTAQRKGLGNFRITHDPAVDDNKKGKEVRRRLDGDGLEKVVDPRLAMPKEVLRRGRGPAKQRTEYYEIEYSWDSNSVGTKPLPPPCAVLLTGLNPLTTTDQISQFLRQHGRIREMDSKMDTKSGMQLGICWVKFDTPPSSSGKTAYDIASTVVRVCDGQRIRMQGDEKIKVVLDGRGLRAQKAVKEEMERRYKPKPKPVPAPAAKAAPAPSSKTLPTPTSNTATPAAGSGTPLSDLVKSKATPVGLPSKPIPRAVPLYANNRNYASLGRSQPIRPQAPYQPPSRYNSTYSSQTANTTFFKKQYSRGDRDIDLRDALSPRRARSTSRDRDSDSDRGRYRYGNKDRYDNRGRGGGGGGGRRRRNSSHYSDCSTCPSDYSESEDDRHYRPTYRRRSPGKTVGRRGPTGPSKEDEAAMEKVKVALAQNGKSHIFIDEKSLSTRDTTMSEYLRDHFRAFHPKQIMASPQGWYILFDKEGVAQNAAVLKGTAFRGSPLNFVTEVPASATAATATTDTAAGPGGQGQKAWRFLTITKKNRPAVKPIAKKVVRRRAPSFSSSSSDSDLSDAEPLKPSVPVSVKSSGLEAPRDGQDDKHSNDIVEDEPVVGKKRQAKPKASTKNKKAKLEAAPLVEIPTAEEVPVAEIKIAPAAEVVPAAAKTKVKKAAPSPIDKLIESGAVVDEEDAYWLGQALAEIEPVDEAELEAQEVVPEDHPLYHTSGSWRAEGFKSIPKTRKSEYLPQQNKAAVADQESSALTSGRTARVTGRRLAHDIETTRRSTTTQASETDTFAFNQLRTRKKQLKFSRSPIEGYGLYAMETIAPGEMVCEYVGEIVRSAVAEVREQRYLKQGIGSSYLFRIDADVVCDATFRGSVSRLINHSCDPSASAKIITINGQSKIVIYARTMLHPGQEILYDYKFPLEEDPALRVPCLCGAPTCRGWLN